MIPFLIVGPLMKALTSMTKSTSSLAEGASKAAADASEVASDGMKDAVLKNVSDSTPSKEGGNKETAEDTAEMFGGLDLANVKSALNDTGPMGPPEQVKGGVYKQIFEVNKLMLGSLQRMEQTMKMLLAIEFERIQGMQQTDSKELISGQEKPKKTGAGSGARGLLGKAASGVGGMLGGAYGKAKGALGGNFGKLLGFGAIILLFKKFETEIKEATADILKYFKGLYDVFQEEGIGAVFTQIGDDLKNVFYPRLKSFVGDMFDMIVTAVKEMIFGASGSKSITQQSGDAAITTKTLSGLSNKLVEGGADLSKVAFSASTNILKGDSSLSKDDQKQLKSSIKDRISQMNKISKESDGRIQWSTFKGYDFGNKFYEFSGRNFDEYFKFHKLTDFIDAMPVVDGVQFNSWDVLNGINLNERAGIDRTMSDERKDDITRVLAEKTNAFQRGDMSRLAELEIEYQALDPTVFKSYATPNTSIEPIGQTYGKDGLRVTGRTMGDGAFNAVTQKFDINKSVNQNVSANTNNNIALAATDGYGVSHLAASSATA